MRFERAGNWTGSGGGSIGGTNGWSWSPGWSQRRYSGRSIGGWNRIIFTNNFNLVKEGPGVVLKIQFELGAEVVGGDFVFVTKNKNAVFAGDPIVPGTYTCPLVLGVKTVDGELAGELDTGGIIVESLNSDPVNFFGGR